MSPEPCLHQFDLLPYLASTGKDNGAGLAFIDRDGRFLFVSEGMAALNGIPAEEHVGRTIAEVLPEIWPTVSDVFERVMSGEAVKVDLKGTTAADPGVVHTWEEHWSPVRVGGAVVGLAATTLDVTDLRASEARQRELLQRQATLHAIANRALADVPRDEVIADALVALQRHLDTPLPRIMRIVPGSDLLEVVLDIGWDRGILDAVPVGPRTGSFTAYVLGSGGAVQFCGLSDDPRFRHPRVFEAHDVQSGIAARVSTGNRPWGVIGGYDRRARRFDRDDEAFIEELAAILGLVMQERESRAFREEILSMASHEIRTPLTSVIGLAQHIKRRLRQGRAEDAGELIEPLVNAAFRVDQVLAQWNELAAAESYRLSLVSEPIDVMAVLTEQIAEVRSRHPGIRIIERYPVEMPALRSDGRRIAEIVDNLLENAAKYAGTDIEVTVEHRPDGVAIHCRDHGPGIEPDVLPLIFDRFYRGTTSVERSGMGLGLYISRKLAEGLGGRLDVDSAPGDGARFTLSLPAEGPGDPPDAAAERRPEAGVAPQAHDADR